MAWSDTDDGGYGEFGGGYEGSPAGGGWQDNNRGGFTKAMKDAWNAYWGSPKMNFNREPIFGFSSNSQYGSPASPHSGMSPMGNMGNIEGVPAGAYGPGPLDPMSAWSGPGWSQGLGQPAFNPNWSGAGSNPMGYGAPGAAKPGFFGNMSLGFSPTNEIGGGER